MTRYSFFNDVLRRSLLLSMFYLEVFQLPLLEGAFKILNHASHS